MLDDRAGILSVADTGANPFFLADTCMSDILPFDIAAFGCHFRAGACSRAAYDVLDKYLFPSIPRSTEYTGTPTLRIQVEEHEDQFHLFADDTRIATATEPIGLVPDLIRWIDDWIVGRLTNLRAVHAGAVQLGDRVLLLPGRTHSGKSSMVEELLRRGAIYLSDEYALIDAEGQAHAYPRPLLVRNGGTRQIPLLPQDCNAPVAGQPAPVGWILELEYSDTEGWNVVTVPRSLGSLILLRHTPHILADCPDLLNNFQRAAADAECYTGHRMDVAAAADEILRLTGTMV